MDKSEVTPTVAQEENVYRGRRRGTCARHCRRFWWVYLIVAIIIILLVVLLVIFVGIPHIAQQKVDAATLNITSITMTQTQSNNFNLAIDSILYGDSSISATFDPFDGVMYLEDWAPQTPFATVHFPQTVAASQLPVHISQSTPISDLNAFTVFNTWLLLNETLRVTVLGNTNVHVSGISKAFGVTFKKTVTMAGLQGFAGTTVPSSFVNLTADANGNNFYGNVTVPNRSIVTFEVGNATFINYLTGTRIGTAEMYNMVLRPGNNSFTMTSGVNTTYVTQALEQKPYCSTGFLPFQLQGDNVTNNGQFLSYFASALNATNVTVPIDIGGDVVREFNLTNWKC